MTLSKITSLCFAPQKAKRMVKRQTLILLLLLSCTYFSVAQMSPARDLWRNLNTPTNQRQATLSKIPLEYRLDEVLLKKMISEVSRSNKTSILPFPSPNGGYQRFKVFPTNTLHPALRDKYSSIQTFEGVGIDEPAASIRFEWSNKGLKAMIWNPNHSTLVINKKSHTSDIYLMSIKKLTSRTPSNSFQCHADEIKQLGKNRNQSGTGRNNDGQLRTYRLALAATGEYTAFHGGTKEAALAAIATTINRVNGVLKRDLAIELQLIPNNDLIVFTTTNDGYSNDNGSEMLEENQTILDNIIGNDNYDIGHVFSTGGGGVAFINSVCVPFLKAGGVTGAQLPSGDAFDVDFVTHEIGHQLGASHTHNNDCNRSVGNAVEPGSGSTIMAYAGICFPNIQNNSDDYFHGLSIQQIKGFTNAADCAILSPIANTPPQIEEQPDYIIPHSTPFELIGIANDFENNTLSYCWEQMDNELAAMPPQSTATGGPLFRSFPPTENPIRQFPQRGTLNNHSNTTWEVLPAVSRILNFQLTVRDNFIGGGNTATEEVQLIVEGNAGPFRVGFPNGGEDIPAGSIQTISWEVASTNIAPINCTNVDVFLSLDGGATYPILLAENIINDGTESIFISNNLITNNARLKIKGRNNVFFDVSDDNFQINPAEPGFSLNVLPSSNTSCPNAIAQFNISTIAINGFDEEITLSAEVPDIFPTHTFESTILNVNSSTILSINTSNVPKGEYSITVNGKSGNKFAQAALQLTILQDILETPSLSSPQNIALEVDVAPSFSWESIPAAKQYQLEIALNTTFESPIYSNSDIIENNHLLGFNLENGQEYYWRVRAINECGESAYSEIFSFTTSNSLCEQQTSETDFSITPESSVTIISPIEITENGPVNSVFVAFDISHTWIGDLTLILESPSGKRATLLREICGNENQLSLNFSNMGLSHNSIPCEPPVSDEIFLPLETFDVFNGEEALGTWNLTVQDGFVLDGGTLNNWSLEVCKEVIDAPDFEVLISNSTDPTCDGDADGSISATVIGGTPNYIINWSNGATQLTLNNLEAGVYTVTVQDATGAIVNATATLTAPPPITLTTSIEDADCFGENTGSISVSTSGGTPSYQFIWANGVRQSNNLNLSAGNYFLTVIDNAGCEINESFTVEAPEELFIEAIPINAVNGLEGSIDLTVLGGVTPYSFFWSNGIQTANQNGLIPGIYSVTVTDANGCSISEEVEILNESTGQNCYNITVRITLDNYGEENRWEIKDGNGILIESDGPFSNLNNGLVINKNICLPPGCYDFTIFDVWGDGMCCAYGQGGYEIIEDDTGEILASGNTFERQEMHTICTPSDLIEPDELSYCESSGQNTQYEWIETVEIAEQVFNSGNNQGYGDFTNTDIDVPIGGTLDLAFTPGFGFFSYSENWQVWIDYNRDGDFEDLGEQVFISSGDTRIEGTIGIPATANPGRTRLRVVMKWGDLVQPCESFSWGEVEDYTINLKTISNFKDNNVLLTHSPHSFVEKFTSTIHSSSSNEMDMRIFPNPVTSYFHLTWSDTKQASLKLVLYNYLGQTILNKEIVSEKGLNKIKVSVSDLPKGLYMLSVQRENILFTEELVISN